jgi:hypothetical protein
MIEFPGTGIGRSDCALCLFLVLERVWFTALESVSLVKIIPNF